MGTKFLIDSDQSKKRRISYDENNGEDIISYLPECITSRILSLLPTKDALRTCVLSKDWKHKWTGIYNIDINDDIRFILKWPCFFKVSAQNLFSSLKSLYLDRTKFLGEYVPSTSKLGFDFPALETLELQNCKWLKVNLVEINAPAFSMFKVICYLDLLEVDKCQIKFSKAKLVKCEFVGRFVEDFDFSATSAFSATIDFQSYYKDGIESSVPTV